MKLTSIAAAALVLALGVSADATVAAQPAQPPQPGQQMQPRILRPSPGQAPPAAAPAAEAAKPEAKPEAKECGGNFDHPDPINWYQGIIGVNNDKALHGSQLEKLLYRYHNDKDECDEHNQQPPFLAQAFNFSILAFLLVRFGKKPVLEGLKKRKKDIMGDIDAAEALRADAESRLKVYEKQFTNIGSRRAELEEEYRAQSETEQKRILAEADEKRARMIKDAELRVQQELRQAQGEILREAVEAAVAAAEELLKKRIEQRDQDRLADEYLVGLGAALSTKSAARPAGGAA